MKNYWYKTGMLTLGLLVLGGCSTTNNNQSVSETSTASSSVVESVATTTENINDSIIKEIPNDVTPAERFVILDYLDYDKIFVNGNSDATSDPRFAHVTPDGKFDWRQEYIGKDRSDASHLLEQITLNGKPITLPTTFAELDPEYAAFDNLNLQNVTVDNLIMTFKNVENQHRVVFIDPVTSKEDVYVVGIFQGLTGEVSAITKVENFKLQKITGLDTNIERVVTTSDLRVADIGVGNTLNEMYETFGEPSNIFYDNWATVVTYYLGQSKYEVSFTSAPRIYNPFTKKLGEVYDNVITGVTVAKEEK